MKLFRRAVGSVLAAAMTMGTLSLMPAPAVSAALSLGTYEVEELEGVDLWTSIYADEAPGYSGKGFAYLTNKDIVLEVEVEEEGMYEIDVRAIQRLNPNEARMQTVAVNGIEYSYNMAYITDWTDVSFGVFRFKKGVNTIAFLPKYGYAAFDTVTIKKAELPEVACADTPVDPKATPETKSLMKYLASEYGKHILSGQQEIYGGGHGKDTTIRYDAEKDICIDQDGNTYSFTEENKGKDKDGNIVVWTCYGEDGQAYGYSEQNHNYNYNDYDTECRYLYELTGEYPAIRGFDFNTHNPGFCWDDGVTDRMIKWAKENNGICTASWHCTVPRQMADFEVDKNGEITKISNDWQQFTYDTKTDFVTANVMVEGTKEYYFYREAMRLVAEELLKLQDAGVPVIFRPLHEAEGNPSTSGVPADGSGAWFWWSKEGAEVYNELWKYLYKTFTEEYGIHNLIWEQNLYAWSDESALWYTGDEWVDMVGFDKYNTVYNRHDGKPSGTPNEDAESKIFWNLVDFVGNRKMVSMPENSTIPSIDNMVIEQAKWSYFCTWYDDGDKFISGENYQNADTVKDIFQSDYCITLSELPKDLYSFGGGTDPQPTETKPAETNPTETKPVETKPTETKPSGGNTLYGDVDLDGTVSIVDVILLNKNLMIGTPLEEQGKINACTTQASIADGTPTAVDSLNILKFIVKILPELPID